ncbi:hypothetical protein, variant [Aphanomyces astaci]|uniref:Uncharacterized protein n=1 Tax=Aphanomyces astaci TaxID=112090 RepID=W4FFA1_APHAT|nr:hypothetical protein, variant [Aphanomyces astaci]ETV65418.1 hypothetical protein, variant [Aphanomyces astaci]|eukprot:XP_009845095.1 hypothetical protein, variant [Aphanomyces astaci]
MIMADNTVLGRLDHWATVQPKKNLFAFVDDNGQVTDSVTYDDVQSRSSNLAKWMLTSPSVSSKGLGLSKGDIVLLVYPPGLDFIVAFLACLRAGVVAVPVYPPDPRKLRKDIAMFTTVCSNAGAKVALTNSTYNYAKKVVAIQQKVTFSEKFPWPDLRWVESDGLVLTSPPPSPSSTPWLLVPPSLDDLAFLQYTSGSTSEPKGVMISHGNLGHNLSMIASALEATDDSVVVSWLPQYHDMGLIGAYLGVLFTGGHGVYMSPFSFIKNPLVWIRLISQYRATHLQAPNFAYALCARKFATANPSQTSTSITTSNTTSSCKLDLSSVRHMINGAEPIDGDAIDAFYRAFEPYGLCRGVVRPTYGLAEHTVYVCDSSPQLLQVQVDKEALEHHDVFQPVADKARATKEMVGCGAPRSDVDVRIVHPDTHKELAAGSVGEIWIRSPSTTQGYFGLNDLTREMFHATIVSNEPQHYMRTGDLGVLYQGELFVCGRLKDLIIVRGRNHYPQDIEKTVEGFPDIRPGCSAAFSISTNGIHEGLGVVAEVRDANVPRAALEALAASVRQAVSVEHGVSVTALALVSTHSIPKTTSGKISRKRSKEAFVGQTLTELYRIFKPAANDDDNNEPEDKVPSTIQPAFASVPPSEVKAFLRREMAQMLDVPPDTITDTTPLQQVRQRYCPFTSQVWTFALIFANSIDRYSLF